MRCGSIVLWTIACNLYTRSDIRAGDEFRLTFSCLKRASTSLSKRPLEIGARHLVKGQTFTQPLLTGKSIDLAMFLRKRCASCLMGEVSSNISVGANALERIDASRCPQSSACGCARVCSCVCVCAKENIRVRYYAVRW
eukprot:1177913-Prorocentrum_minimum.AAC.6